ncbi:MAG: hypothetical protein NTX71_07275 [Candidatus Aureabacteria bacterium]|nr:hypothetical protein [Candidatus Auribacterota bacterium]
MHTSDKPLTYGELLRIVSRFSIEIKERGNKCFLFHPDINGRPAIYTLHKPHRKNDEYSRPVVAAIRRRFGISLDDFYSKK